MTVGRSWHTWWVGMNSLKKRFNKCKRRIELGVQKPGDIDLFIKLSKKLGYKNYLKEIEAKNER